MADILSLSKARKAKARSEKEARADENRAKFGRSKAQKALDAATRTLAGNLVDAHKRDK